jgi:hypothetical protein
MSGEDYNKLQSSSTCHPVVSLEYPFPNTTSICVGFLELLVEAKFNTHMKARLNCVFICRNRHVIKRETLR